MDAFEKKQIIDKIAWWIPIKTLRNKFRKIILSKFYSKKLESITINVIDDCNLNCYGCFTVSQGCHENSYQDIESFEKDLKILKKITYLKTCHLTGGEPLLHKDITDFILLVRKYFPGCFMMMVTNGILLDKKDERFWEVCRDHRVLIRLTPYPIKLNMEKIKEIFIKYNIRNDIVGEENKNYKLVEEGVKYSYNANLDMTGSQDIETSFSNCIGQCESLMLKNGKIYKCAPPMIEYKLKKYFNLNFELFEDDYIDLYKMNDNNIKEYIEKIDKFMDHSIPFCRYCKTPQRKVGEWRTSKKVAEEYLCE